MTISTKSKGNWNQIKGKLKEKFTNLTDNDLALEKGKEDETFGRLQAIIGKPPRETKYLIDHL